MPYEALGEWSWVGFGDKAVQASSSTVVVVQLQSAVFETPIEDVENTVVAWQNLVQDANFEGCFPYHGVLVEDFSDYKSIFTDSSYQPTVSLRASSDYADSIELIVLCLRCRP